MIKQDKIYKVISRIVPNASFNLNGDTYQDIIWNDSRDIPTEEQFNEQMDIDWFDCKYREISDENKIWEPVRSELSKSLLAKQHSNPAQFIKRVKAHGRGLRHGYPVENNEGSGQEDGAKNRAPFDRVEQELGKLYKYLNNPSNDETIKADPQFKKLSKANESITKILRDDLGIDLNRYSNAD